MPQNIMACTYAAFSSGRKFCRYEFPSPKIRSVHLPTRTYYSETRHLQQPDDNSDFTTLTFAMAAAADELFCLTVISP